MAKLLHFFFLVLFSNALLFSQISTSTSTSDAGQLQLTITNNSSKTITAYIWSRQETLAPPAGSGAPVSSEHQFDTVGSHLKPVLPGESRVAGTSSDPKATLTLVAAIFEDGSTFGNADLPTGSNTAAGATSLLKLTYTRNSNYDVTAQNSTTYGYDGAQRLTSSSSGASPLTYDQANQLTSAESTTYGYDNFGRLNYSQDGNGHVLHP